MTTLDLYTARAGMWRAYGRDPLPPTDDPGWLPYWGVPDVRDEFDGAAVNAELWNVRDAEGLGNDWGWIVGANATVQDGYLRLRCTERETPMTSGGRDRWYDTAYLDGLWAARYGRWEMRAKLPTEAGVSKGLWPAFWLRNNPSLGEIDIMEAYGDPATRSRPINEVETSVFTVHQDTNVVGVKRGFYYEHRTPPGVAPYSTAQGYHVWAVEVVPGHIRAYLDDHLAVHLTPDGAGGTVAVNWAFGPTFDDEWHIRLNLQMGDSYYTPAPTTAMSNAPTMPADYLIDYVRYWAYPES